MADLPEEKRKELHAFLAARTLAVIATADSAGVPEAALINYAVTPSLEIIFETTSETQKYPNLKANPVIALVAGWDGPITLQYRGLAQEMEGAAKEAARDIYLAAFPQKSSHEGWPGNFYFRVRPLWIRFSSYYQPRHVEEYQLGAMPAAKSWWRRLSG
jgi:hypothetical protein